MGRGDFPAERRVFLMRQRLLIGALIIMIMGMVWTPAAGAHRGDGDYIRLHVIANSDSEADQAVKHKVRDAILDAYGDTFAAENDITDAEYTIHHNLETITAIARRTLTQNGMSYGAVSQYGMFPFPTRQYGDVLLPAGKYHALRVILGEGAGANWWCVLFPPLCVHDTSARDQADESDEEEKDEAPEIEEEAEQAGDDDESSAEQEEKETRPKIKFKIVEWVKGIFK